MKNSTVRNGKSRSKISSVGVGQPNARRKMPIVTSIAIPASTPAATPIRTTARKDRDVVDLSVAFMACGLQLVPPAAIRLLFWLDRKGGRDSTAPCQSRSAYVQEHVDRGIGRNLS